MPLNFANIIALPLLLGVGVAFKIYYVMAWRAGHDQPPAVEPDPRRHLQRADDRDRVRQPVVSQPSRHVEHGQAARAVAAWTLAAAVLFQPALDGPSAHAGRLADRFSTAIAHGVGADCLVWWLRLQGVTTMSLDIAQIYADHEADRFASHTRHLNEQMVRVLKTLGYDVGFVRGTGQYLFDRNGAKYLDLLSGYGVFAVGRNHPALRDALKSVLDADLPGLVQFDVSPLAGVLAQRLLGYMPYLDKVFFANSGTEAVEAAIKFARGATRRTAIIHCEHSFHGLTYGALSLNGDAIFRNGFEPLLPDCTAVPFNDLAALEQALSTRNAAAFIVEPIQGKGVNLPDDNYLREASELAGATARCSSPTRSKPGSAAPAASSRSTTGASSRTWF